MPALRDPSLEELFERFLRETPPGRNPILPIGDRQLAPFVHTPGGQRLLAQPGRGVPFVRGGVNASQIQ